MLGSTAVDLQKDGQVNLGRSFVLLDYITKLNADLTSIFPESIIFVGPR